MAGSRRPAPNDADLPGAERGGGLAAYRERIGREKRGAILDAAVELFIEAGYDGATLEQVARRADVSTGTLFKYFPTKAALFGAIMARVWEVDAQVEQVDQPGASVTAPKGPRPALPLLLQSIGLDYARLLRAPHVEGLFRVVIAEVMRFPELGRELYERGKKPYLDRLHAVLEREAADGRAVIPDIPLAARQFLGMINDLIFWPRFLVSDLAVTEDDVDRVVAAATATFLARYAAQPPGAS
ncbi:MAG: TetR/AcrR family transcriptional regulator [Hyphomonadaceae bacterium]|nr:TetR/AcrR family transcriptional regulator [Hyphomonadaceae bacterium]